jgi:DNA-directed RNA polymerase specialized sigma24 family protein
MDSDFGQGIFDNLFRLLEPDAGSVEQGFRQCRLKLVEFFAWRHCEDPDNLADETISRLLRNVHNGQEILADNPYSYVYGIASNVFREYLRDKGKAAALIDIEDVREVAAPATEDDCKKLCLDQLPQKKRELLATYYLCYEDREGIAAGLGLTLNALRLQVHRIKHGLKRCMEDCRKHSGGARN